MSMLRSGLLLLALHAAGCAAVAARNSEPPRDRFRLADGTQVACRMEKPTGSNIPEQVCERVEGTSLVDKQSNDERLQRPTVRIQKGE